MKSRVIRDYGLLNDRISPSDGIMYGIPYPGVYVTDEDGLVVAKFFHDTYKKRDSPEILIDAALGRVSASDNTPASEVSEPQVKITARVHGGNGSLRQGIRRQMVVHFEPDEGFHLYGNPVPEGMFATEVSVTGPDGLIVEEPILPPTKPLRLEALDTELQVYSGAFDIILPFFPDARLVSEVRPLDSKSAEVEVSVRYQACDNTTCMLPQTVKLKLELPLDVVDVPSLSLHTGHGQREGNYNATPHLRRLIYRVLRRNPLDLIRFVGTSMRLNREARERKRQS